VDSSSQGGGEYMNILVNPHAIVWLLESPKFPVLKS
jgi:hypothetical protein